ncbi:MAG: hypothetical protein ACO3O3_11485 [Ilumatobacteraceae bacterium]
MMDEEHEAYWKHIFGIAKDVLDECNGDEDAVNDAIEEYVEGSAYVTYYSRMFEALIASENTDAIDDHGDGDKFWDYLQKATYYAVQADVMERVRVLKDGADV